MGILVNMLAFLIIFYIQLQVLVMSQWTVEKFQDKGMLILNIMSWIVVIKITAVAFNWEKHSIHIYTYANCEDCGSWGSYGTAQ